MMALYIILIQIGIKSLNLHKIKTKVKDNHPTKHWSHTNSYMTFIVIAFFACVLIVFLKPYEYIFYIMVITVFIGSISYPTL